MAPAVTKRLSIRCVSAGIPEKGGLRLHWPIAWIVAMLIPFCVGCDSGLEPPAEAQVGVIDVRITYAEGDSTWPPPDSLHDLRFVAMRFVPSDTADFLQLNRMVFSDRLRYNVSADTARISDVAVGPFLYSGVAQKFGTDVFAWRPVGLVESDDGVFIVRSGETTQVEVHVDFRDPPPFPPPPP